MLQSERARRYTERVRRAVGTLPLSDEDALNALHNLRRFKEAEIQHRNSFFGRVLALVWSGSQGLEWIAVEGSLLAALYRLAEVEPDTPIVLTEIGSLEFEEFCRLLEMAEKHQNQNA